MWHTEATGATATLHNGFLNYSDSNKPIQSNLLTDYGRMCDFHFRRDYFHTCMHRQKLGTSLSISHSLNAYNLLLPTLIVPRCVHDFVRSRSKRTTSRPDDFTNGGAWFFNPSHLHSIVMLFGLGVVRFGLKHTKSFTN